MAEALLPPANLVTLFQPYNPQEVEISDSLQEFNIILSDMNEEDNLLDTDSSRHAVELVSCCPDCREASSPLVEAVSYDHVHCLKEILRLQPNVDILNPQMTTGVSLSHIASRKGCLAALKVLIEFNPSLAYSSDYKGATPLHTCAYHGQIACLRYLLSNTDCSPNVKDNDGASPVHFAAVSGHLDCLKELFLTGKADINATTNSGETPVYFAAQEGHLDCMQWLVEQAGARLNIASYDGMTPIHAAAQSGQLSATHWLIRSANCPVNMRTSDGATPVHFAAAKGHVMILEWMLHHKLATGLERDDYGATPVHDAAENGQLECLHVFYNHSVKLDFQDADGLKPKDLAEEKGQEQCVAFLRSPRHHLQNWIQQKRQLQGAWQLSEGERDHINEVVKAPIKKRMSFSFLSKIKIGSK